MPRAREAGHRTPGVTAGRRGDRTARIPLILDVDTGIDDALALLYAAASPEAELVAVTCLPATRPSRTCSRNTRASWRPPAAATWRWRRGRRRPSSGRSRRRPRPTARAASDTRNPRRRCGPPRRDPPARLIAEEARRRPGEVTLVTLGPLSTLARALELEPDLPGLLHRWVLMGGAYRVPGNTTPASEWNVHCDPEAAARCFAAWSAAVAADPATPRVLAMGLDVTEGARLLPERLRPWSRGRPGPRSRG